jgi:hypothetical protein
MIQKFPLFSLSVVFCLLLCSCAAVQPAAVYQVGAGETIAGMRAAMAGQAGTFIMQQNNLVLLAWPNWSSYSFAVLDISGRVNDLNGLHIDTYNFSAMVKSLETGGWKYIEPAAVPAALAKALAAYSVELVMAGVQSLPSVLVVPVMVLTPSYRSAEVQE